MAGVRKPDPYEAFLDNMNDAQRLVAYAKAFTNKRKRRVRQELRNKLAAALGVSSRDRDRIDGLESDDLFVVFKPSASLSRAEFTDLAPLLRQAVVAGCAATETFLVDWTVDRAREVIRKRGPLPARLADVGLTVEEWHQTQQKKYPRRAITDYVVAPFIREHASTAPSKVGELLSMVGIDRPLFRIDGQRHVGRGTTEAQLQAITDRRNRIAHASDRVGRRRAGITVTEVQEMLGQLRSVVEAINSLR